ncbi:CGNR zinc finger domain-containing protein [Spongiactinospora sp. TRM90649]|uniref:CGNR zinc finger domain-containing protein n=1 Tax=Spongiactinospora sp. TRM90649 TaxID=3031114 RepID=UPI0023F62798|nr:CGNR zinc finger domain-containing protein [Spongiactinospora sp. TRM90649]MDF5754003.1 CGNR zinc finger domain-containing protein [Spongiactinospora sp. TRM90649]
MTRTMASAAELVRDFVNTYDVEGDLDEFASPAELTVWLREHALSGPADRATEDDLALAVHLREGLRAALRQPPGGRAVEMPPDGLESVLSGLPLRIGITGIGPVLVPLGAGIRGGLAAVAAAVAEARADGVWARLKVCAEDSCRWAFIDASKNRSRSWCSMKVCGNRTKTRAYRARQGVNRRTRPS